MSNPLITISPESQPGKDDGIFINPQPVENTGTNYISESSDKRISISAGDFFKDDNMINKILELYARCGKSLLDDGINDVVLPISVANEALELFEKAKWTVLGGDVYQCENNKMNNFYADWHCNLVTPYDSCNHAREHLRKLQADNIYITFTIKG